MDGSSSGGIGGRAAPVVLTAVILLGGYFAIRTWMQPGTQPSVEVGRAAADAFLASVREGDAGAAWDATTVEFKSIEGRESFIQRTKSAAILKEPLSFGSVQDVTVADMPRSEFLYTSTQSGGTVRVLIGYEGGAWKVDRLAY